MSPLSLSDASGRDALKQIALLQLASPALPIGGYSYSSGLEWAIESGVVSDEASAAEWVGDALMLTLASFDAPLMLAALRALRDAPDPASASLRARLSALNDAALAAREMLGPGLAGPATGYMAVYCIEIALLIATVVVMVPLIGGKRSVSLAGS